MGIFEFLFGEYDTKNNKSIMRELANLQDFGIDGLENTKVEKIFNEELANYEYYIEEDEE